MAVVITSTGFQNAVDYKVIQCTGVDDTTAQTNLALTSGTLHSIIVDSTNSSDNVSVHILDTADTTVTQLAFKGKASGLKTINIPGGYPFTELKFWVSKLSTATDTTAFACNVDLTFVCG